MNLLKFGKGNAKLGKHTLTFALPAGHYCPFAKECLSKANKYTGKIQDGKDTKFRCFGATVESMYKGVRAKVWHNADLLREVGLTNRHEMSRLIFNSLMEYITKPIKYVRIHETGGDFFNQSYLEAWCMAITKINKIYPHITFYCYTKACNLVYNSILPDIASVTYSRGGTQDNMIVEYGLKEALVVNYTQDAEKLGLEIDIDDSLARNKDYKRSFALLIHGTQPKGSVEGKAVYFNVKNKIKDKLKKEKALI